jgi:flagellar basal body rod protein FlgC
MPDAVLIARSALSAAIDRLDVAARRVANADLPPRPHSSAPITGATGAPSGGMGDPAAALLDLMTAELAFRAGVEVVRTATDLVRSLYEIVD